MKQTQQSLRQDRVAELDSCLLRVVRDGARKLNGCSLEHGSGFLDTGLSLHELHDECLKVFRQQEGHDGQTSPAAGGLALSFPRLPVSRNSGLVYLLVSIHQEEGRLLLHEDGGRMRVRIAGSELDAQCPPQREPRPPGGTPR